MIELFLKVVNMSISASWLVLTVFLIRLFMKKVPKWIHVILWGLVGVRLAVPVSFESIFSLIPSAETISPKIILDEVTTIHSDIPVINHMVYSSLGQSGTPNLGVSANPLQVLVAIFTIVWIVGIFLLLAYMFISYWKLRKRVVTAVPMKENIYQCETVTSPFVLGVVCPRIYLPFHLNERDADAIIAHEKAHIKRHDHWWKPFGFLLLTLHWFNPLIWIAYVLLCRDIELACDEKVIKKLNQEQRANYSQALLAYSISHRNINISPLAFGEVGVKKRVRTVLNYKKPSFWIVIVAIIVCIVVAVCFLTNPKQSSFDVRRLENHGDDLEQYHTEYIGDAFKVSAIAQRLPYPEGYSYSSMELQTSKEPYELKVYLKGKGNANYEDFKKCANIAFDRIANMGVITFCHVDSKEIISSFKRGDSETDRVVSELDEAIASAIHSHCVDEHPKGMIHIESYVLLANEGVSETLSIGTNNHRKEGTVYLFVLHKTYNTYGGVLEEYGGSSIPTAITFSISEAGRYTVKEYWKPRDGRYYDDDIRDKFPKVAAYAVFNSQAYIEDLEKECYHKATAYLDSMGGLDLRIAKLLDTIQTSLTTSSNMEESIKAHDAEYQELISYGEFTLRYCFGQFLSGGQTDQKGKLMEEICNEIIGSWGFVRQDVLYSTGQDWFESLKENAERLKEQYSDDEIEKFYPASWLLLEMLNS